ncbi:homeobox protein 5 isoform X15 [Drosophila tropicalis]|uniref:homeobox protein 5 isoform X15 n=1 Tax=Drosophila tropicalis TaxID=46794 RepID=UPI0035AB6B49
MDLSLERDSSALGSLFQQIINDMKNTSPLWEDFVAKASKLHTCLRAAIQAIAAYLDAFQKIADAATNSRGASKEIGTALTRVCLRHKAVETRLKTFTSAIMDCLVQPLQDKIEDWKRTVATIDKDHAKEYKRCRTELKKRSSDTLRLQKKARKGQTDGLQSLMDSHMQDVTLRRAELEEVEKKSLRQAMVEERLRYCSFVHMLQPVVHEECEVMSELGHLQEAMQSIALVTKEPNVLPQASEELIHDAKASINLYPESPGGGSGSQGGGCSNSLGSRKSSVCSISSMNSSGSSNSPGHHHYQRSLSQFVTPAIRLKPGESSDSGFCSSPALTTQASTSTNQTHAVSTWPPHSQDVVDTLPPTADRPHTISTAYEKGHQRPPLTVYTFQNPETIHESSGSGNMVATNGGSNGNNGNGGNGSGQNTPATQKSPAATLSRPPLPVRCSSLERPLSAQSNHRQGSGNLLQRQCPSPIPAHITKGTPSAASSTGLGFVYQVNSPTPPTSEILKITEQSAGSVDEGESGTTETDERSRASVLQKASMFEKAAAAATSPPLPVGPIAGSVAPNGGRRSEEMRAAEQQEMDKSFEDSIQALNNLIGELDSFQREIDEGKGKQQQHQNNSRSSNSNNNNSNNSGSLSSSDNNNILATSNIDLCAISNQTNSSGCGTDISDTNSDEHLQQHHEHREQHDASDSELSRCYVSETSSLTAGYENPTFAHLSREDHPYNNGSVGTGYAGASDTISLCASSDSVCLGQPRHAYVDTCSDSGSAVVVIYDHQIPNTADVEFVKQNSEIVVLRTKDPQLQLQMHEMRELQQLPTNLAGSPESSPDSTKPSMQPPTATVAPAKQRLSSFRASSEQQLQLLGRSSPQRGKDKVKDQQPGKTDEPTVKRTTLPPKPTSLSIFNGPTPPPTSDKPLIPRKSDFKADLDAKIRRQKLKVQHQLQQQQQQQQQEQPQQLLQQQATHSPQSPPTARNCNVTNQTAVVIASSSTTLSIPSTSTLLNSNPNHRMPNITATFNHKTPTATSATFSSEPPSSSSSTSLSSSISPSANALAPAVPARPPQPQPQTQPLSTPPIPSQAKPCITPRPASLSSSLGGGAGGGGAMGGGSTRIARRSSINQAKPPPPVRRSSSVTPSPNATMGPPPTNLYYQQQAQLSSSSEHLPPPPAFMLDAHHNATPPMPMPPLTLPSPPTSMPSSALKVSETVRALAAMRHQPASPVALRRMQQQQQHHQQQQPQQPQQPFIQSLHNFSPSNDETTDYEAYYNSYMELHAYAEAVNQGQKSYNGQQQQLQSPPHHNHQQPLPPTPPPYHAPPQADAPSFRTSSPASGGNNGGGIYAQPKLVNSMSSFRTSSPSPNGHAAAAAAHPLPPTQPKANPNLIAQLNARLNSNKQHTTDGGGGIYGNQQQQQQPHQQQPQSGGVGGDSIYMRSGGMSHLPQQQHFDAAAQVSSLRQAPQQHPHQHQQQQQQQQQQQHYTCPPPLEDPPPPPIYSAGSSATMPKKMPRAAHAGQNASHMMSAYAASGSGSTATLPKNIIQQQRLQQQQQQQYQQPQGMGNGNGHPNQRPQLPLPQQQQKLRAAQQQQQQQQQHLMEQQRQPPIPSRHSSVQQKIFVSTNPFIQTTAVKFHSPSASPTCGSPVTGSSLASIYATTTRGSHHHQQQQQHQQHQQQLQQQQQHYYRDVAGGNSNGYNNHNVHAHTHNVHAHHPNYATNSTNIEKTGSIRAKTKAEFLENLNAKLAKQGMSGRAFAVRNLINSKALMYQNPQKLSRPSAQYRRPPTYPTNTTTPPTTNTISTCDEQC